MAELLAASVVGRIWLSRHSISPIWFDSLPMLLCLSILVTASSMSSASGQRSFAGFSNSTSSTSEAGTSTLSVASRATRSLSLRIHSA